MKASSNAEHVKNVFAAEAEKARKIEEMKAALEAGEEVEYSAADYVELLKERNGG